MGKIRVHELAKKLNLSNQELLTKLKAAGVSAKTHSSNIDEALAMRELEKNAKPKSSAGTKPRTMLRRRRKEVEEVAEPAVEETPEEPIQAVAEEVVPLPVVEEARPEEPVVAEETQTAAPAEVVEAVTPVVEAQEPEKPADPVVPAAPEKPIAPAELVAKPEAPVAGAKQTNVVRVINADAIKARLAAEGRTFRPRAPRPGTRGVREIKVVRGTRPGGPLRRGAAPVGAGGAPTAMPQTAEKPGGARPSKRGGKSKDYGQDAAMRREMKSGGGYELWIESAHKKKRKKKDDVQVTQQAAAHKRVVELTGPITVHDLAHQMSIKAGQVVTKLMGMGMMVTVNQSIDPDTASIIASEFEYEVKNVGFEEKDLLVTEKDDEKDLVARPPVVTVMGHVDHGKTSVLDAIRGADVVSGEAGGITQHIGAHYVQTKQGAVTFLDTPGHEAFTSMRARGAEVTDIVVLVVAADDGVMPQTLEAIDHAKAAKVPIVVAINKMDLPDARPERVMQQLADREVIAEEWGGDVQFFKVSAMKKEGLEELLDGLVTLAEMLELKANPKKMAEGTVIEAKLDRGRGPVATVLVQAGTLNSSNIFVAGEHPGRIRAMYDSSGKKVNNAGPSIPVQILGLPGVPLAGDPFNVVKDDRTAKTIAEHRQQTMREKELLKTSAVSLETFMQSSPDDDERTLKVIVKADVFGSSEALSASLRGLSTPKVKVDVIRSSVGAITESDINLALASGAVVIGFNARAEGKAQVLAMQEKVDIRHYDVIYEALEEVKKAMAGLLAPVVEETVLGKLEVRAVFPQGKSAKVAGCFVLEGLVQRGAKARILRAKKPIFEGKIGGLKRFKDDVREVKSGYECGVFIDGCKDLEEGDIVQCFELKEVAAVLDSPVEKVDPKADEPKAEVENQPGA